MFSLGKHNRLRVLREAAPGLYLDGGDGHEILLPGCYIPPGCQPGDVLDVFVCLDSKDRPVATTDSPLAMVGEFAVLTVINVHPRMGAFLYWGLPKDLLLPFREQSGPPLREGDRVVVFILLDAKTSRLVASMHLKAHLSRKRPALKPATPVSMLITARTPLGYNAIVNDAHEGLLYHTDLAGPLEIGRKMPGYVLRVRPDKKIDLRLDASGARKTVPIRENILQQLRHNGGRLPFDDNSSPEKIREAFNVSKKAFKLALSTLYRQRRISFCETGIQLASPPPRR